jgi:2-succinyl-6-hydroxy-2,4-cyclohexadiene-1-carboxylate synthase
MEVNVLEKRIKVNQVELQVRDDEHPGEAIIFLHFSGANLMMWHRSVPYFQDRYRIVLIDLRGHGKSDQPETGYHMDVMASDLIGIMAGLDLDRAHVIGSSLGAEVGLSLAANDPEKVLSLVCDGALKNEFGPYGTWQGSLAEFEEHVTRQLQNIREKPDPIFPSIDALVEKRRELLEEYGLWNSDVEAMERYGANKLGDGMFARGFGKKARENYFKNYFRYRLEDYYSRVKCPILMLAGEEEFHSQPERTAMEGLSSLAAQAEIVPISGWQHPYGWLLDPAPICQAILNWLTQV